MAFDPTTVQPEEAQPVAPQKAAKGVFDPSTVMAFDPTTVQPEEAQPPEKGTIGLTGLTQEEYLKLGYVDREKATSQRLLNATLDITDMALGFLPSAAQFFETLAADVGSYVAARQLGGGAAESVGPAMTAGAEHVAGEYAKPENKSAEASLGPMRAIQEAVSGPRQGASPVEDAMGAVSKKVDAALAGAGVTNAAARQQIATGLFLGTPDTLGAAKNLYTSHVAKARVAKIAVAEAAGIPREKLATEILKRATERGVPGADQLTKEHIVASLEAAPKYASYTTEDLANAYGTGVERRTGERATHSQLAGLNKPAPSVVSESPQPPQTMRTDQLDTIKLYDRNTDLRVDTPEVMQTLGKAIDEGKPLDPVTITVSTKDNLAFMSDGAHRVALAKTKGLSNLSIRIEQTDRSFSGKVKDVARDPAELGLTPAQIKAAPWEAGLETKSARVSPEEVDFGAFSKEYRQEKAKAPLEGAKAGEPISPIGRVGEVAVTGEHFSQAQREILSGQHFGTGLAAEESYRLKMATDPRIKCRISFYVGEEMGVTPEAGVGTYKHTVPLHNLYDASKNPLKLPTESFLAGNMAGPDFNRFESAVLDAGFDGYVIKGAFGKQGGAVLLGKAAEAVKVAPKNSETMINVGLNTNDGVGITRTQVEAALRDMDVLVVKGDVHASNTEPTFAAKISRPLTPEEANRLSVTLKQEAIAQTHNGKGELYGPQAKNWGPFNPDFFLTPDGKKLNEGFLSAWKTQRGVSDVQYLANFAAPLLGAFIGGVLGDSEEAQVGGMISGAVLGGLLAYSVSPLLRTANFNPVGLSTRGLSKIQERAMLRAVTAERAKAQVMVSRAIDQLKEGKGLTSEPMAPEDYASKTKLLEKQIRMEKKGKRLPEEDSKTLQALKQRDIIDAARWVLQQRAGGQVKSQGQAFKQRGAIGNLYTKTFPEAMELATAREGEVGKETPRGWQVSVPMDYAEAGKLHPDDVVNLSRATHEVYKSNYFKKQRGVVDQQLIVNAGLMLGGAALGAAIVPNGTTKGLLLGAAVGFGLANLPRATKAMSGNWKSSLKTIGLGVTYAGVGAVISDSEHPVEGALLGSALFGLRFLKKAGPHEEDALANAYYGNRAAEDRLIKQVGDAKRALVPDLATREFLSEAAEKKSFTGRTPQEAAVVAAHRGMTDSYAQAAQSEEVKMGFIENYVSHIIESKGLPPTQFQAAMQSLMGGPRGAGTGARFAKERAFPTFADLRKALQAVPELQIKTMDIAEIGEIYSRSMTRTIEQHRLIRSLTEATDNQGNLQNWIVNKPTPGYVPVDTPQLRGKYVSPDIAPTLEFVFDPRRHSQSAEALFAMNRATKRINVFGTLFHAGSLLTSYKMAGGGLMKAKGAIEAGVKLYQEAGLGSRLDKGMRAGLRLPTPEDVSPQALSAVGQLADQVANKVLGSNSQIATKVLGKAENFQQRTFDKFTWDYVGTGTKVATFMRLMEEFDLKKDAQGAYKGMKEDQYMQAVASHVNKTFGGLDWYKVVSESKTAAGRSAAMAAFKPSSRDWLGVAAFAPDWGVSTMRAMADALPGGSKNPVSTMLARRYALRTAVLYGVVLNSLNYALSGHNMWDNQDPLRVELGDGTSVQFVKHAAEYGEWVTNPTKTFSNKMGFAPRMGMVAVTGKEYPGGPSVSGSKAGYMASQIAPFTARSFSGETSPSQGAVRSMLGMLSINIYGHTEAEKAAARDARQAQEEEMKAKGMKKVPTGFQWVKDPNKGGE